MDSVVDVADADKALDLSRIRFQLMYVTRTFDHATTPRERLM